MIHTTEKALAAWGMTGAACTLVAARENRVFKVTHGPRTAALRLHRTGYRSDAELQSELRWIQALSGGGLSVATPVPSQAGALLHVVDGVQISMLGWLGGRPMGASNTPLDVADRCGTFHRIGAQMARLHLISDAWPLPDDFTRPAWDMDGLIGNAPLWGRFWENPTLDASDRALFERFRARAQEALARNAHAHDYGLIHADLLRENIMLDAGGIHFIDFDDGGFGYRLFDIATALIKNRAEPDYADLRRALITGYRTERAIATHALDLFMVLRAMTYVGWIVPRMEEDGAQARNARFILQARELARGYLDA